MFKKTKLIVPVLAIIAIIIGLSIKAEAKKGSHLTGTVNINNASAEDLTLIPGIGPSKAAAIVSYRETEKFNSVEDLIKVKGIGEKLLSNIQPYVTVDGPTTAKMVEDESLELDTPTAGEQG